MDEPIRIIQVGDGSETADALRAADDRFEVETAAGIGGALGLLEEAAFDCVVSSYELPDGDGIEFLETVRETYPDLPFILFTGTGDEAVASDAISAGVTDYIRREDGTEQYAVLANRTESEVARARAERERNAVRERMRALFSMIPEPIAHVRYEDGEPVVLSVNAAFEDTFGYDESEAVGESVNDLIVPPKQEDDARTVDERVREHGSIRREVRRRTTDGVGDFIFRTVPVDDDDQSDEYFGVYIDISEQKATERQLQRQNERLDEFVGIVTHDLQGPLTVADYHLEQATDEGDGADHIEEASLAIDRMESLIEDLLALARSGIRTESVEPVELGQLIRQCWRTVDATDASLVVEDDPTVRADESRLRQLLENLLWNAVEHGSTSPRSEAPDDAVEDGSTDGRSEADPGPGEGDDDESVTVTVGELDDGAGFYVADDGPGIPDDERERVFERGYSTSVGGTGFGLAIVGEVAAAHDWDVRATESDAGGARIEVSGVDIVG